jgi:hypothetical protein
MQVRSEESWITHSTIKENGFPCSTTNEAAHLEGSSSISKMQILLKSKTSALLGAATVQILGKFQWVTLGFSEKRTSASSVVKFIKQFTTERLCSKARGK